MILCNAACSCAKRMTGTCQYVSLKRARKSVRCPGDALQRCAGHVTEEDPCLWMHHRICLRVKQFCNAGVKQQMEQTQSTCMSQQAVVRRQSSIRSTTQQLLCALVLGAQAPIYYLEMCLSQQHLTSCFPIGGTSKRQGRRALQICHFARS